MFGPRYFGHRMFGPRYFGDGSDTAPTTVDLTPPFGASFTDPVRGASITDPVRGASITDPARDATWS